MSIKLHKQHLDISRRFSELNRHATKPEFVYRHQWRANDIVLWDNRCSMHMALADFDQTQRHHMEHTTVLGTRSGYAIASASACFAILP